MKKVIHSPSVGQPKPLISYDKTELEAEPLNYSERIGEVEDDLQLNLKKIDEYLPLIEQLREENDSLISQKKELQEKYDTLLGSLDEHKLAGKELGYKDGIAQAEEDLESRIEKRVALGETLLSEIKKGIIAEIYDQEGICLEIVYSAISRLIGDSAGTKEQIKAIVRLTMEKVASQDNLQIYLSPEDYKLLKDDEFIEKNIIQSDELEFGGCVIKTGKGTVEAKLDDQLAKLKQLLLDIHKAG